MGGSSEEYWTMGASLIQQRRVEEEGFGCKLLSGFTVTQDIFIHFVLMPVKMMSVNVPQHTHLMQQLSNPLLE